MVQFGVVYSSHLPRSTTQFVELRVHSAGEQLDCSLQPWTLNNKESGVSAVRGGT